MPAMRLRLNARASTSSICLASRAVALGDTEHEASAKTPPPEIDRQSHAVAPLQGRNPRAGLFFRGCEPNKYPLHCIDPCHINAHVVITTLLASKQREAAPGVPGARTRAAQVRHRGEVLFIARRSRMNAIPPERAADS